MKTTEEQKYTSIVFSSDYTWTASPEQTKTLVVTVSGCWGWPLLNRQLRLIAHKSWNLNAKHDAPERRFCYVNIYYTAYIK